jgi:hypothetical protein
MTKRVLGVTGLLTVGLLLSRCATNDLAAQYEEGSSKGHIAGGES